MAEENEVVERVADALEHVDDEGDTIPPAGEKPKGKFHKLKAWGSLMTHAVALLAAAGAFAKSCDHSVTQNAYEALAQNITKLSDNQEKLGKDVANIHGYLEGMRGAPLKETGQMFSESFDAGAAVPMVPVEPPRPPPPPPPVPTHTGKPVKPAPSGSSKITWDDLEDGGLITFGVSTATATLAPASPPPAPVKPPPFSAVEGK